MPGRARRQLLSFQQDNIGATPPGQVVRDAATDDAPADDDDTSVGGKIDHDGSRREMRYVL
jgi:hypothetical protein